MSRTVRAGGLIDVANGEIRTDVAIEIDDEQISDVRSWTARSAPSEYDDLSEYFVAPGLIDMHTHLVGHLAGGDIRSFAIASQARNLVHGISNARKTLRAGFTTVRDLGTYRAFIDLELRDAIDSGVVEGPRMICAGAFITATGGSGAFNEFATDVTMPSDFSVGVADGDVEVRKAARRILQRGADVLKVMATGAVFTAGTTPGSPEYSESEIRAAVEEAANRGRFVAAHAHGDEGIKRAVAAGVRTIEHGSLASDGALQTMLEHGTYYVPTTYVIRWLESHAAAGEMPPGTLEKTRQVSDSARRALRMAVDAGVRIAYGTDAVIFPHGLNANQFEDFVDAGMTPLAALRSATSVAAEALGRSDIGSIEVGRFADLIAIKGTTFEDVRALTDIHAVMKSGSWVRDS